VPAAPEEQLRPEKLWHNRDFLRIWLGSIVSSIGSGIVKLAAPLLVLALTDSPAIAGLVAGALTFPMIFLGLPAGALIDRLDRRRVMIVCDTSRTIAIATIPIAWLLGGLTSWQVVIVALALGCAQSFYNVAEVSALPRVVQRRQISMAQSLNSMSEAVALLTSPGIAGVIIAAGSTVVAGAVMAYGVNSMTFAASVLALLGVRTPFQGTRPKGSQPSLTKMIAEGLRYVWNEYAIRLLMVLNGVHRLCFAPVLLTVVVFSQRELALDPAGIGLLFTTAGAGGLSAAAVTPWLRRRVPVGWHMIAIVAVHALALALVAASSSIWLVMLGLYFEGMMETMTGITQVSFRLALIPDAIQGRVNSVYRLISFAAMSVGSATGGLLIDWYGPRPVMWIIAGSIGVIAVGSALSDIRTLRD
jgi:MFS family permease